MPIGMKKDLLAGAELAGKRKLQFEEENEKLQQTGHKRTRWLIGWVFTAGMVAILCMVCFLPMMRVESDGMSPTLEKGQCVMVIPGDSFEHGDIIAFYYDGRILLKRIIACPGEQVEVLKDGSVYVNGQLFDEPYASEKCYGSSDLTYPYQVPENRFFVMGDQRSAGTDSRTSQIGTVAQEQIVGKVVLRFWPLKAISVF